ncbi:MAG: hypothetical protein KBS66_00685 [Eubacterium sp.]|nr:hypothetical protein [Candidatus Colimonas fimequi]
MAIPKAKKAKGKSQVNEIRKKAFEEARWYVAKTIFPNFETFVLMAVIDELSYSKMKNFNLTPGEKKRFVKSVVERTSRYCEKGRTGDINPFEARTLFEKEMEVKLGEIFM